MSVNLSDALVKASAYWEDIKEGTLSLDKALAHCATSADPQMKAAVQSILHTAIRHRAKVDLIATKLMNKTPSPEVGALLDVALALLVNGQDKTFTVVNQTVIAAKSAPETARASDFINAILRNYLRNKDSFAFLFSKNLNARFNAPGWWISKVRKAFPNQWESLLDVQTKHPPLTLRVNRRKISMQEYLDLAQKAGVNAKAIGPWAVIIDPPCPVQKIPGFSQGLVSVQDAGSQLVTEILKLAPGSRVLDACAAPGGKTAQLLENYDLDVTAIEIDPTRAPKINETLSRLGLKAEVKVGSAADIDFLESLGTFDAIVLDAPCTASGIVRRHPDIPWARRQSDIEQLAQTQAKILDTVWQILPNGKDLLYVVCSIFPEEGPWQIQAFLSRHKDAILKPLPFNGEEMLRLIPTEKESSKGLPLVHDGFFYALLSKKDVA